ncbi:MAG: RecX family transcriptional regulator [Deltaproteobacteria bacterium]|nr:RecX family transcriptional regulator [Deltaproteobacteria bacterium]
MKKVTAIHSGKRGKRVNIYLNEKFAFSLEAEVALKEGLKAEKALSEDEIEALKKADLFQRCLNAAFRFLSYRPRSEAELRQRLQRRGFDGDNVAAVLARLKERGLADDLAFAQFWKDNRQSFSPRSQWLTRLELRQKGIAQEIIDRVAAQVDDEDCAYRAAVSKARRLSTADYENFSRRLGEYLKRRGFSYGLIKPTVERVWQERGVECNSGM